MHTAKRSVKDYRVAPVSRWRIASFIVEHHYSKSVKGLTAELCFALYDGDRTIGGAMFGPPATPGVAGGPNIAPPMVLSPS